MILSHDSLLNRRWAAPASILALLCIASGPVAAEEEGLPTSPVQALKMEHDDSLPRTQFYDTPATLSSTKPGDLLRQENFADYTLPAGAKAVRILYHSQSAEGRDVATSAVVLIPAGTPPSGGWPLVAWAHGTSGVARQCAPSLMKDVYYGDEGLYTMLGAGLAIVATDYHGLGTEGPHQYIDKIAQAHDVIYSVPAAQKAVPSLSRKWVADGHSQGGLAAWAVAETESGLDDPSYLGAVSVAGATHLKWLASHLDSTKGAAFYIDFFAYAIHARFPEFKPSDMLSPAGLAHYDAVTTQGCWYNGYATYAGTEAPQMVKPGWTDNPWYEKFSAETTVGDVKVTKPVFVIAGEGDNSVPIAGVRETVRRACTNHDPVTFRPYPGLDHDPTMINSTPDQIAWIKDRFADKPAPGNCPG